MNYIGSKFSLLPEIKRVLDANDVPTCGIALDLFAGTGVVGQFLKKRGHIVYANDWQYYSYLTCVAFLEHNALPEFRSLLGDSHWGPEISRRPPRSLFPDPAAARVLSYLTQLPGRTGAFYEAYCEGGSGGRQYFSRENGLRIQAIRDQIEAWARDQLVAPGERAWLVASLLEGADRAANTASVYGAYLKHIKSSARKPLRMYLLNPVPSEHDADCHRVFCEDSEILLQKLKTTRFQLVYIDPPYNCRQYNTNYHILETLARWDLDRLKPRGVTGLRDSRENRSDYCMKRRVERGFRRLISLINAEYVLFSYNDEGLVSKEGLESIFGDYCSEVTFDEIPYKRFRADLDGDNRVYKGDSTMEYLVLGKLRQMDQSVQADCRQANPVTHHQHNQRRAASTALSSKPD